MIKRILLFVCLSGAVSAQPSRPVAITIDPQMYAAIVNHLNQIPALYSRVLLNTLEGLQAEAQKKAAEKSMEDRKE